MEGDDRQRKTYRKAGDFNPLPPCGGRRGKTFWRSSQNSFQSTPSVWRETMTLYIGLCIRRFQSTPSVWRETVSKILTRNFFRFQSTPSVWRETPKLRSVCINLRISIHSLRVEGDPVVLVSKSVFRHFNPLPPCGGRRWNLTNM